MKIEKKNLLLTIFCGVPISLVALYLSGIALWGAVSILIGSNGEKSWAALWLLLGVVGLWAVFTGIRNLLRFDTAHLQLRWHDWIGGIFGTLINLFLFGCVAYAVAKDFRKFLFDDDTFWVLPAVVLIALPPIACFCIVAYRYFKQRRQLTCKN